MAKALVPGMSDVIRDALAVPTEPFGTHESFASRVETSDPGSPHEVLERVHIEFISGVAMTAVSLQEPTSVTRVVFLVHV